MEKDKGRGRSMKELVCISGKGGTGKTSLVASFAAIAEKTVMADCDVDAPDLHLVLKPQIQQTEDFKGGMRARIVQEECNECGTCLKLCRFEAIIKKGPSHSRNGYKFMVDPIACEGCGVCSHFCPQNAIRFEVVVNGKWFISETRFGPMVHAALGIAEENSGKLVSLVRSQARRIAEEKGLELILVDGSPGIGCPVIASLTGADLVLIVTEPTLSGFHDLDRVVSLAVHFQIPVTVCMNKADINPSLTQKITEWCEKKGIRIIGRIPYDQDFTKAQIHGKSLVEFSDGQASRLVREVWERLDGLLKS
jgi:MinD superfamily P-loop ATPase